MSESDRIAGAILLFVTSLNFSFPVVTAADLMEEPLPVCLTQSSASAFKTKTTDLSHDLLHVETRYSCLDMALAQADRVAAIDEKQNGRLKLRRADNGRKGPEIESLTYEITSGRLLIKG